MIKKNSVNYLNGQYIEKNVTKRIKAIRGMSDYIPSEVVVWQRIEGMLKKLFSSYGYREIRFPIAEQSSLFKRAIGRNNNVVERELYTFKDHKGTSLSLRPEGTVGCIRAGIENGLLYNQEQRLWYLGPMFRYERPQKGRYRQFFQAGVEVFGLRGPDIEVELLMLIMRLWRTIGITKHITLEVNSIGSLEARSNYQNVLVSFLEKHKEELDDDCKRRLYTNPLRILDSKNPKIQLLLNKGPSLGDYLDDESKNHFFELCNLLNIVEIPYIINQRLVRGLDYYNRTVFEWVTGELGSQGAICAGGRYDGLVGQLGGKSTPAVGFAIGLDRLVLLSQAVNPPPISKSIVDVYLVSLGKKTSARAMHFSERIRDIFHGIRIMTNHGGGDLKKQLSRADKLGAKVVLVLNESEFASEKVLIKDLRTGKQEILPKENIEEKLRFFLK